MIRYARSHTGIYVRGMNYLNEKSCYDHVAENIVENDKEKVLWDFVTQTDHTRHVLRPHVVAKDKQLDGTCVTDTEFPWDI